MTQDLYETLQVHPRADTAAIQAAYQRLRDLYDPARLDGAADELLELARAKRDAIEHAYAVLGDPVRRTTYDAEQAVLSAGQPKGQSQPKNQEPRTKNQLAKEGSRFSVLGSDETEASIARQPEQALDYRPLPPAQRQERPRGAEERTLPVVAVAGRDVARKPASRVGPIIAVASILVLIIGSSLLLTEGGGPPPAPPTPTVSPFDQYEAIIPQAQSVAQQNPKSAQAWIDLGNVLYDSAQIVRESAPDSPLYQQRLGRWLQATNAYSQALALEPTNATARADLGASSCFYGSGTGDQTFVSTGMAEVERAAQIAPNDERVLLSMGHCLVSSQPPKTDEAIRMWQKIVEQDPASPFAAQVKQLIEKYGSSP